MPTSGKTDKNDCKNKIIADSPIKVSYKSWYVLSEGGFIVDLWTEAAQSLWLHSSLIFQ